MKIIRSKWMGRIIITLVLGVTILWCPPVFYLNDDVTMRSILSGAYTGVPDGHAVYMQYPLTGFLACLYRLVPVIPWMELFFLGSLLMGMICVAERFECYWKGAVIALVLFVPFCLYMHYTLVAALLAATGVFLLTAEEKYGWAGVFLLFAYLIRSQIGLLALPFAACAIIWSIISCEKNQQKEKGLRKGKLFLGILVGMFICSTINAFFYRTERWQEYLNYNEKRTVLYDYTDFLSTDIYEKNPNDYGMTKEEVIVLSGYNTLLDSRITADKVESVAQAVTERMKSKQPEGKSLINLGKAYYSQMRYQDKPFNYLWVLMCGGLAVSLIWNRSWKHLIIWILLLIGRSGVWMYLIDKGRFPERVSLSLYMIELMLLLGMFFTSWKKCNLKEVKWTGVLSLGMICVWVSVCGFWGNNTFVRVQEQKKLQLGWTELTEYCENQPHCLYLVDVFSAVEYAGYLFERNPENVKMAGGWLTTSPLSRSVFEQWNAIDGGEALYQSDKVRLLVAKNREIKKLESYFISRFGNCELVKEGEIDWPGGKGFVEYSLQAGQ